MTRLNHQHLFYFWTVAKEGSVAKACKELCLAQPTISGQVIQFEKELGKKLFERHRKRLVLTKEGRLVFGHAEKIFNQTREMLEALKSAAEQKTLLRVGVDNDVSKEAALKLLQFVLARNSQVQVQIDDGGLPELFDRLQRFTLDAVLSGQGNTVGETGDLVRAEVARLNVLFVATPPLARRIRTFPRDLSKWPLLIPSRTSSLWEGIRHFLVRNHIEPTKVIEIQDAGLMRQATLRGLGIAPLSSVAVVDALKQGTLIRLGRPLSELKKNLWLTARKDYDRTSLVGQMMQHFRIPSRP